MRNQKVCVFVESEYRKSRWCQEILRGIELCAVKQKLEYEILYGNETVPKSLLQNEIILLLGTSEAWLNSFLSQIDFLRHKILLVNTIPSKLNKNVSCVTFDRKQSMIDIMEYMVHAGRTKIALFGFNSNSSSDMIRTKTFFENYKILGLSADVEKDLYLNNGSVEKCAEKLMKELHRYDAIICGNDPVAICIMNKLKKLGYKIPDDFYIIGFGNSILANKVTPTLTTVDLNYFEIGKQAVNVYSYMMKHPEISSISVYIPCVIALGESTNFDETKGNVSKMYGQNITIQDTFFKDSEIEEFFLLEHFFEECDEIDIGIIKGIMKKIKYNELAEMLHISEYTLKYRLKKIYANTKVKDRNSFIELLNKYEIQMER